MSGAKSRRKGANAEREVIGYLQPVADKVCDEGGRARVVLQRRQVAMGRFVRKGYDIEGVPWLALEVKRHEKENVGVWWRQTLEACGERQTPVLIYRANYQDWTVRMKAPLRVGNKVLKCVVTIYLPTFLVYFEYRLKEEMGLL